MLNIFVDLLCLKYGFCKKSLLKDITLTSWTLFSSLFFQITYKTHISIVRSKLFRRSAEFIDKERHRDVLEFLYHYDLSCFITLRKVKILAYRSACVPKTISVMPELDIYFAYQLILFQLGWEFCPPFTHWHPKLFAPSGVTVSI